MRTKKRMTKFLIAAVAVSVLGAVAPASAGCVRGTLYVQQGSQTTYVVPTGTCLTPNLPADEPNSPTVNQTVDVHSGTATVGVQVWVPIP